jgi:diaminohydroxyphosphoribosylaminopyrimidine deaminase/5-amino-6-(5-phosphoribosylamino)uracil reductase
MGSGMRVDPIAFGLDWARPVSPFQDVFAPFREAPADRPFVVGQLGQSLDGRIATLSGESRDISGDSALTHLHRIRAHVDAVVVGVATVIADDPRLTVRRVKGRNPARVVIDPSGRLDAKGEWLARDGARRILVTGAREPACDAAEIVRLEIWDGYIPPAAIVEALFARGLKRLLIEGGARTLSAFLEAGVLDRLHLLVAPVILGSGRSGLELSPIARLESALRPRVRAHILDEGDVLFDCDFSACRRGAS